ncbi:MAG: glycosyltransferase family 2 protein, partial [Mucilaginibacter polytrichastri]|nr:glycosyltransferase family 2 protein [Mucilaginibacter polytrichastri]
MTDTSQQGISVIICCHNSKNRIGETLRHLAAQKMPAKTAWEILLIDNASTDSTADFAHQIWAQVQPVHEVRFQVIREEALGLTNARLCGIRHAAFDLLLFCDDDNWLDENYVQNAVSIFEKHEALGLAGTSAAIPVYETEPPQWLGSYTNLLACFSWDKTHITDTTNSEVSAAGCGMVIRRALALRYAAEIEHDKFRRALDRKGSNTISGGDTDINYAVIKYGFKIGVFSELKLQHFIPKERMTVSYI